MILDSELHGNPAHVFRALARDMSLDIDAATIEAWAQECAQRGDSIDMREHGPSTVYGYLKAVAEAGGMYVAFASGRWTVLKELPRLTA